MSAKNSDDPSINSHQLNPDIFSPPETLHNSTAETTTSQHDDKPEVTVNEAKSAETVSPDSLERSDDQKTSESSQFRGKNLTRNQKFFYILTLGALNGLGPFTVDMYLPALQTIQQDFHTTATTVQLTLAGTMIGFALGQLCMGPLSDQFGRKKPLLTSLALHLAASLVAATAPTVEILTVARIFQGIGAAGGAVITLAIIRDLFSGYKLVQMLSRMALVSGLAPVAAPVVGGYIFDTVGWHGVFYILAGYSGVMLIACACIIKETYPAAVRKKNHTNFLQRYKIVLSNKNFLALLIIGGLNFSGLFAYVSQSTYIYQNTFGLSVKNFTLMFAINSVAIIIGVQATARLLKKKTSAENLMFYPLVLMIVSSAAILISFSTFGTLVSMGIPLWFYILGIGALIPNVQTLALEKNKKQAGTAASLLGAVNFGFAGIIAPLTSQLSTVMPKVTAMGSVMFVCITIAFIVYMSVIGRRKLVRNSVGND